MSGSSKKLGRIALLSSASALLYSITFPDINLWFIAYIALVPFMFSIRNAGLTGGFLSGLTFGTVSGIFMLYWTTVAMTVYGNIPWGMSSLLLLTLGMIIGLIFFAPLGIILTLINRTGISPLLSFPAVWVTFEWLKTFLFTGFPWNLFGYSQFSFLRIIQISDITGVFGVSFLLVFVNAAVFVLSQNFMEEKKIRLREFLYALLLFITVLIYGTLQESKWNKLIAEGKTIRFGLIQGNIEQDQKWEKAYQDATIKIYSTLTEESFGEGASIVIWPETATPFYFQTDTRYRPQIIELVQRYNGWLIFGSPAYTYSKGRMQLLNSAYIISPEGNITGRYDKMHLVPFGEYVPLKKILFFVDKLVPAAGDFSAGREFILLSAGNVKFSMSICYEIIFPDLVRKFTNHGADVLVTITNDAWFGRTSAPYQHFAMAAFRAVENRRPMLRAANTGITGYVDQTGRVIARTEIFKTARLNGEIRLTKEKSFYTNYGNVFCWMCGIATLLMSASGLKKR